MNKPLIGKIIGCCVFAATSVISIINFKLPEETKEAQIDSVLTEIAELDPYAKPVSHKVEEKKEEAKEESAQGSVETATPQARTTKNRAQTALKSTTKITSKPATTQASPTRYTSVYDFEHAMLGICPQNVPSGVWPDKLRPIVSLGYRPEEKYGPSSAETAVAIWWSSYKLGKSSSSYIATATTGNQIGGDCGHGTDDTLFKMNYNTLTVYWEDNAITPNGKVWADGKAQYMTNFLRSINSQFKAKCGY